MKRMAWWCVLFVSGVTVGAAQLSSAATPSAHQIDILLDASGSMKQVQPALQATIQTQAWSLVLAAQRDAIGDVALTLTAFCEDASAVTPGDERVFDVTRWTTAARALGRAARHCRSAEDGLNAVDFALERRVQGQGGHLLLVSDEPRAAVHPDIDPLAQLEALYAREVALDAMLTVVIRCSDGRRAVGLAPDGTGYLALASGAFDRCTDARLTPGPTTIVSDYASLAIASGGSVWDVNALRPAVGPAQQRSVVGDSIAQAYASVVLDRADSGRRLARPLASVLRATPGEMVHFDGSASVAAQAGTTINEWRWDFDGDGMQEQFGPNAAHAFPAAGLYPVSLEIVDSTGQTDRATLWIEVDAP